MYDKDKLKQFLLHVLDFLKDAGSELEALTSEYTVTEQEILTDLKLIAEDIFDGTVREENNSLTVDFNNGQSFKIFAMEVKQEQN